MGGRIRSRHPVQAPQHNQTSSHSGDGTQMIYRAHLPVQVPVQVPARIRVLQRAQVPVQAQVPVPPQVPSHAQVLIPEQAQVPQNPIHQISTTKTLEERQANYPPASPESLQDILDALYDADRVISEMKETKGD